MCLSILEADEDKREIEVQETGLDRPTQGKHLFVKREISATCFVCLKHFSC